LRITGYGEVEVSKKASLVADGFAGLVGTIVLVNGSSQQGPRY